MRHCKGILLSTLSLLAILSVTTTSYAGQSIKDFKLLRPQAKWKVGTVDTPEGVPYCAIVNQFDDETVIAFSRNAEGQGSVAMDFRESFFRPGVDYEVSMRIDDSKSQRRIGRASSESSVVVQIGDDEKFYAAINEDGNLRVSMRMLEATFALRKLSESYVDLLECAGTLPVGPKTAAVPVPAVDKQDLASGQPDDADVEDDADAADSAPLKLSSDDRRKSQDALKEAVEKKDREIAEMQAAQKRKDLERAEDIDKQERSLARRVEALQKDRDALRRKIKPDAADTDSESRSIKASLKVKDAELAEALRQQKEKVAEMTSILAETQEMYKAKLLAAAAERQKLKEELDSVMAENAPLRSSVEKAVRELSESKAQVSSLETDLSAVAQQKQELAARIEAQEKQTKLLQAALGAKEKELSSTKDAMIGDSKKLASVQAEMNGLVVDHASVVGRLQAELKERDAKYAELQAKYEEQNKTLPMTFKMAAELAAKKVEAARLQQQLSEMEVEYGATAEHAQRMQAELMQLAKNQAQKLAAVQSERDALDRKLHTLSSTLESRKAVINRQAAQQAQEIERLKSRNAQLAKVSRSVPPAPSRQTSAAPMFGVGASITVDNGSKGLNTEEQDLAMDDMLSEAGLMAGIETFAGGNAPVPLTGSDPNDAKAFLDRIMSYHRPIGSRYASEPPAAPEPVAAPLPGPARTAVESVTLESLLNGSGMAIDNFIPVEQSPDRILSRWTAGKISGMYEAVAATGSFEDQVGAYLDRYRQDCNGKLQAHVSPTEASAAGTMAMADIECSVPLNKYVASLLFLQDSNGFNTILHTSYPSEKKAVRNVRDTIVQTLKKSSSGFSAPQVIRKAPMPVAAEAEAQPQPQPQPHQPLRFNIPAATETAAPVHAPSDELETVIIQ